MEDAAFTLELVAPREAARGRRGSGPVRLTLDVTDPEPLPREHPLWDAPGVLITPHLAGDSPGAERLAFALVGEQLRRYLRGEPLLNVVEPGY